MIKQPVINAFLSISKSPKPLAWTGLIPVMDRLWRYSIGFIEWTFILFRSWRVCQLTRSFSTLAVLLAFLIWIFRVVQLFRANVSSHIFIAKWQHLRFTWPVVFLKMLRYWQLKIETSEKREKLVGQIKNQVILFFSDHLLVIVEELLVTYHTLSVWKNTILSAVPQEWMRSRRRGNLASNLAVAKL